MGLCAGPCACVRAGAGLGESTCQLGWSCPGASSLPRAPRWVTGVGVGVEGVMLSRGRRGKGGVTTNLLSALLIMLVRVKLASGSKKGARGGEGGREGTFVRWH